jgi:hypothetical protein
LLPPDHPTVLASPPRRAPPTRLRPAVDNCRNQIIMLIRTSASASTSLWFMQDQRYRRNHPPQQAGVPVRVLVDPRANPTYGKRHHHVCSRRASRCASGPRAASCTGS